MGGAELISRHENKLLFSQCRETLITTRRDSPDEKQAVKKSMAGINYYGEQKQSGAQA